MFLVYVPLDTSPKLKPNSVMTSPMRVTPSRTQQWPHYPHHFEVQVMTYLRKITKRKSVDAYCATESAIKYNQQNVKESLDGFESRLEMPEDGLWISEDGLKNYPI